MRQTLVLVIQVLACLGFLIHAADIAPQMLNRTGYFDIASRVTGEHFDFRAITAFTARPEGLYFLLAAVGNNRAEAILQTDAAGNKKRFIHLSKPVENWLAVDNLGQMYVWFQTSRPGGGVVSVVYVYSSTGALLKTAESEQSFLGMSLTDGHLVGVIYPSGAIQDFAGGKPLTTLSGPALDAGKAGYFIGGLRTLAGGGLLGALPNINTMYTVDLESGKVRTTKLESPEITHAWSVYKTDPKTACITCSFSVDEQGKIYFLVTGQPIGKTVVLQVNDSGAIERSLRCPVAAVDILRKPGAQDGYMSPNLIGSAGQIVFIVDTRGHVVSCPAN
jgi:hypothetical protein